jgi:hypothetical protein
MDQALEAFGRQAQKWKQYFAMRVRVALALREDDGWHLWYSYTAFLPELAELGEPLSVETKTVRAFREFLPLPDETSADRAVTEVLETPGTMRRGDWVAELAPSVNHLSFEYEALHLGRFAGPRRLPALTAHWHNQYYQTLTSTKQLDQELQLHETPFDGFADLASALNIPVGLDDLNRRRFSEFVLLSPVELIFDLNVRTHSELKHGELSLVLKAHPAVPTDTLRLGVKALKQKGSPDRFILNSGDIARDAEGLLRVNNKLSSPDVPVAQVFASFPDDLLGTWWVRDFGNSFNDRMLLHRSLDANDQLKSAFFERPEQFEDKVLLLLTLMGLTSLKYGKIQTDAPDILAISTARHVFVVECTTGDINSRGKLQRLSDRAKKIRDKLSNSSNPPVGVVPVVFTSLPRDETAMHWDTAATFQIAIAARENIINLLNVLDAPIQLDQLYAGTLSLIPSKKVEQPT